jgi:peroxiredoxin
MACPLRPANNNERMKPQALSPPRRVARMTMDYAPELVVKTWFNTDRPLYLSALRGRVVVLVAFQVLCPTSIASGVPQARRIFEMFEPKDVVVIGLHTTFEHHDAFSSALLNAFIHEYRLKFPIALDEPNPSSPIPHTMERYKMRGTPSLVLIDRQGLVRKHAFGAVEDLRLGAEIGALTQAAETAAPLLV